MSNDLFVKCACGSEGINISLDEGGEDVFFSMWYYGKNELTWQNKLRWIWHIIKGNPYVDEVVITPGWLPLIIDVLGSMKVDAEYNAQKRIIDEQ